MEKKALIQNATTILKKYFQDLERTIHNVKIFKNHQEGLDLPFVEKLWSSKPTIGI